MNWGPQAKQGAVVMSFDNLGEASDLEFNLWPEGKRIGFHRGVYEELPFILDVLKEYGLKSSFFIEAWNVEHYPDAVRAIAADGHEIGSHGYRHESVFALSDERQVEILQKAHDLFESIAIKPVGWRPPGAISTAASEAYIKSLGYIYASPYGGVAGVRDGLAIIPSDMHGTDISYYTPAFASFRHPEASGSEGEAFVQGFRHMLDGIAEAGDCRAPVSHMTTPLHTQERRDTLRRLCDAIVSDDRLWCATMREVAEWMLANPSGLPRPALRGFESDWDPRTLTITEDQMHGTAESMAS